MLSGEDKDRVEAAVAQAESATTGEIVCVLAQEVAAWREVPLAFAAVAALALPPLAVALGVVRPLWLMIGDAWAAAQPDALESQVGLAITVYAAAQIALFVAVALIVAIPTVRRALTPGVLKRHRVAAAAHQQFAALSAHSGGHTGVLIFVALADRRVQILAHEAIHAKAGEAPWTAAAAAVTAAMRGGHDPTAGIVKAVEICGAALAEYFPGTHGNLFSARPVEL